MLDPPLEANWQRYIEFDPPPKSEGPAAALCEYAQDLSTWAQEIVTWATDEPSHIKIAQAKVMLLDKYFEWRNVVPKTHRNRIVPTGHACIFHVFEETYRALKAAELKLTPPQLYLPVPPKLPRTKSTQAAPPYAGTVLGEIE